MSDLVQLHQAITSTLEAAIPQLQTIASYAAVQQDTPLPALFHSIVEMKPASDPGDGHSCVTATFEARIVVDARRPQSALEVMALAARLMVVLRQQYWGVDFVEEARAVNALPQGTEWPAATWVVKWEQVLHIGESQWPWPNQPPGSLVFAFDPDSGPGNEGRYQAPEDFA